MLPCLPPALAQDAPPTSPGEAATLRCERQMMSQALAAIAAGQEALGLALPPELRLRATSCLANSQFVAGQGAEAAATTQHLLGLLEHPDLSNPARTLGRIRAASLLQRVGRVPEAIELLEHARREAQDSGAPELEISALISIGHIRSDYFDDTPGALPYLQQAYDMERALGRQASQPRAILCHDLGYAHLMLGHHDQAEALFDEADQLTGIIPEFAGLRLRIASHRAEILRARGNPQQAEPLLRDALERQRTVGDRPGEVVTLQRLARTMLTLGDAEQSLALARQALALAEQGRFAGEQRDVLYLLADAATATGEQDAAKDYATRARALTRARDREITARKLAHMQAQVQPDTAIAAEPERDTPSDWLRNGLTFLLGLLALGGVALALLARRRHRELAQLGNSDPLTGLPNRRGADDALRALATTDDSRAAVMLVDLDGFKTTNDSFGHDMGDRVLAAVAQRLRESCEADDLVARWGGDELLVLRGQTTQTHAFALASHLRQQIEHLRVDDGHGGTVAPTLSIGVASLPLLPGSTGGWQEAIRAADRALYVAKRAGRNAWVGVWGLEAGIDGNRVLSDPQRALAEGWIAIDGSKPMDWSQSQPRPGAKRGTAGG